MDEISAKGKTYVKAKLIARELGYTTDYVGQLCRSGKVDAELVGRTWYVDPSSIKSHKKTRYRSAKASTHRSLKSEVIRNLVEEQPQQSERFYSHRQTRSPRKIEYETDEADLLPSTNSKSVDLPVELADAKKVAVAGGSDKQYQFEAPERQETKFFGTLKVTEFLTEVPVDELERGARSVPVQAATAGATPKPKTKVEAPVKQAPEVHEVAIHTTAPKPVPRSMPVVGQVAVTGEDVIETVPLTYRLVAVAVVAAAVIIVVASLGLETKVTATNEATATEYTFTVDDLRALLFPLE